MLLPACPRRPSPPLLMVSASSAPASKSTNSASKQNSPAPTNPDVRTHLTQFAAGALAGLVNTLVLSPLDVVKTRLQVQGAPSVAATSAATAASATSATAAGAPPHYTGTIHALRSMLQQEGLSSYYRGLSASLWAFVPNWAIYWYSYEAFKRLYARRMPRAPSLSAPASTAVASVPAPSIAAANDARARNSHPAGQPALLQPPPTQPPPPSSTPLVHVLSALSAGALTAVTTAPFWTLKSRLQVDMATAGAARRYRSVTHGFRRIVAEEGVAGLYKGLTPTMLGLGHVAIQFPLYEHLKRRLARADNADRGRGGTAAVGGGNGGEVKATHVLVASSVSKLAASVVFYPHEVIRTRIQVDTTAVRSNYELARVVQLVRNIVRNDGARGLYRGFATNLVRTVPACMLTFTSYELAKRFAERRAREAREAAAVSGR